MTPLRWSSAHYWVNCSAWPRMVAAAPPQPVNDAALEGTCAAWVAECVVNGDAASAEDFLGETHANGWSVDAEMVYWVDQYLTTIDPYPGTAEVPVSFCGGLVVGTSDHLEPRFPTLVVDDLKYGHDVIEVRHHWQTIGYAVSALQPHHVAATCSIYQPRSAHPDGPYRSITYTRAELDGYAQFLYNKALLARDPAAVATPGTHCANCPAAATCDALARSNYRAFESVRSPIQFDMSDSQLSAELEFLELASRMLESRQVAVRAEAESRLRAHRIIRGWAFKGGLSQRAWRYPVETIALMLGVDMLKPAAPKSPADIERELKKVDLAPYTTRAPTKPKLARFDADDIARIFAGGKKK